MFTSAALGLAVANLPAEALKVKIVFQDFYLGHLSLLCLWRIVKIKVKRAT